MSIATELTLDPVLTLDPTYGLVSEATVYPPNESGLWRTVALLANGGSATSGFASAVGAFDVRRRGSLIRGAGEAVERFALAPVLVDADYLVASPGAEPIDFVTTGLGRASALACDFPWYRATELLTGAESQVPAPVVDYRPGCPSPSRWERYFDPSPNGAASGPSEAFAQASALVEVLERDAFLSAWRSQAPLRKVDLAELPQSARDRSLAVLLEAARTAGVHLTLAFVGNDSPVHTAVCVIIGATSSASFGAVGLKASADPLSAMLGALQEGLQIRELFLSRKPAPFGAGDSVTGDSSRADFWSAPQAVSTLQAWLQSFPTEPVPAVKPVPGVDVLVRHLASRGIDSHWVDLTHRLPTPIAELGWITGKVVCPGAVQLTMDETKNLSLFGPVAERLTLTPHPLI
ncbi:YcaO-like family protein [Paenarthrobacter sp. NPDC090522]|uniref:YcaO-like family protein n=1 Tax=Paenarthrobacter sp. NPDC090522 TaxID=3364383 RepID=UPI00380F9B95